MSDAPRFKLPAGFLEPVWQEVGRRGVIMRTVQPCTALGVQPGPYGECWSNALALLDNVNARPVLGDGWFYVEGITVSDRNRVVGTTAAPGLGTIKRHVAYPHAWVVDRTTGIAYEPTAGHVDVLDGALYVGFPVSPEALDQVRKLVERGQPAVSALELAELQRIGRVARVT